MLVLTRKANDSIKLPQLAVEVRFLACKAGSVKIGVDAPKEVVILRGEIADAQLAKLESQYAVLPKELRHQLRNDLNELSVGLHLYRELQRKDMIEEGEEIFDGLQEAVTRINASSILKTPLSEKPSSESQSSQSDRPNKRRSSVLVVEDEANEREMLAGFLRLNNLDVYTASDGLEAINYFENQTAPAFLMMDMQMPNCDGATAISQLRDRRLLSNTRVFAISGSSASDYSSVLSAEDVNAWFPKPLNPASMLNAMNDN